MTYKLCSRIDSSNADEVEKQIRDALPQDIPEEIILDASELTYIASAGLRVLLRLKKEIGLFRMIHTSSDVYEILELTGWKQRFAKHRTAARFCMRTCI